MGHGQGGGVSASVRRVLLLGDERKGVHRRFLDDFAHWLGQLGHEVEVELDRDALLADRRADLVVCFGGDGSLLGAARRMGANQLPTLGVNFGRLGFLTSFEKKDAKAAVEQALCGALREEPRLLLYGSIRDPKGHESAPDLLMNDAVISRTGQGGMVTLRACRDGEEIAVYRGDGLICATAAGSTAYSLAAGGPVVAPDLPALVLTPLASHSLSARPLVLPVLHGLEIAVVESSGRGPACVQFDGQVRRQLALGASLKLWPAPFSFRHLGSGPGHFFQALRAKFGFAGVARPIVDHREEP